MILIIPIEYELFVSRSVLTEDGAPTVTTTPDQSGSGNNDDKRVLHTFRNFRTGASPSDEV